jgi:hypothetical protein
MLPWPVIAKWSFFGLLGLLGIMEIVEDRDGMHQEFDQWSDKQYEKKHKKAKAAWEKEKKEFLDKLNDAPAMLERARKLRIQEESRKQRDGANLVVLKEDDEQEAEISFKQLYDEAKRLSLAKEAVATA